MNVIHILNFLSFVGVGNHPLNAEVVELARHAMLRTLLELNPVKVRVLSSVLCLTDVKCIVVHVGHCECNDFLSNLSSGRVIPLHNLRM